MRSLSDGKIQPGVPSRQSSHEVVLTCLEPGQFIPVHHPGVDMMLVVLEGEGQAIAGHVKQAVRPGSVIFAHAGEARGAKADSRLVALHVVSPPPAETDHVEMMAKLKQGNRE